MKQLLNFDWKRAASLLLVVLILSLFIYLPDLVFFLKNGVYDYAVIGIIIVTLLVLIPVVFFFYNLKIYYYILALLAALTPFALLPVFLINSMVNSEMLGLVLETNYNEATELLGWWQIVFIVAVIILFFILFVKVSKKLPQKLSFKTAALISVFSLSAFLTLPLFRTTAPEHYSLNLRKAYRSYYPFRISNSIGFLSRELKNVENYNKAVVNFSYGAQEMGDDTNRKIHVLIIGETARYDHWSINGYGRETSPNLKKQSNLLTFSNVASGGPMTHLSIPLIITRADAGTYNLHQKERSIFRAYKEVGYKTFWISNQSKYGLAGHIGMHYADADTTIFNGWGQNNKNYVGNYDSALIPIIQDVIETNKKNDLFLLVHTIGSHYRYLLRYPPSFTKFQPVSDRNRNLVGSTDDELLINEYDNSILYTDFIINQIIETVKAERVEATITYVSDHGENLNDDDRGLYFHSYNPTKYTIKVPMFLWLSDQFIQKFPGKFSTLQKNKDLPVSSARQHFFYFIRPGKYPYKKRQ